MLKYPCLVLDHDDTVVQTERTIGYPYFRDYIRRIRPGNDLSFSEYVHDCNNMIFADMCRQRWQMTEDELWEEYIGWKEYSRGHIPTLCPGIETVIRRQKAEGGLVCVASLSTREIITRDYMHHFGFLPDAVYDYDLPADQRKPFPFALEDIMRRFDIQAHEMLLVDDMKLGWDMAQSAGVQTAYAAWNKAEFPELTEQMRGLFSYFFDSTKELEKFLFD